MCARDSVLAPGRGVNEAEVGVASKEAETGKLDEATVDNGADTEFDVVFLGMVALVIDDATRPLPRLSGPDCCAVDAEADTEVDAESKYCDCCSCCDGGS